MDFENTSSVRIYRDYEGWDDLSVKARALFVLVAQDLDPLGFAPKGIVVSTAMALGSLSAVSELVQAGFLCVAMANTNPTYRCAWWAESQAAKRSGKLRAMDFRRRRAAEKLQRKANEYFKSLTSAS